MHLSRIQDQVGAIPTAGSMNFNKKSIKYYFNHWKIFAHLLFRTKRFGVNNERWSKFDSLFGLPWYKIIFRIICVRPLIVEWEKIKFRANVCHFISDEEKTIIGW